MERLTVVDAVPDVEQITLHSHALGSDVTGIPIEAGVHDLVLLGSSGVPECVPAELFRWCSAWFPPRADDREET